MATHGYPQAAWEKAKSEARQALYGIARKADTIPYSHLVARISSIRLDPHGGPLRFLLGEIAQEDDDNGLGLTSALVVYKDEPRPGPGFFEMAKSQGRVFDDPIEFWVTELKAIHRHWARQPQIA